MASNKGPVNFVAKRPRLTLGKGEQFDIPDLLCLQKDSYRDFLQVDADPAQREDFGLHAAFSSVFPVRSHAGTAELHYVSYHFGENTFDVAECKLRGLTYGVSLKAKMRLVIYDKDAAQEGATVKDMVDLAKLFHNKRYTAHIETN